MLFMVCLERFKNVSNKILNYVEIISENHSLDLNFNVFLGLGACPGMPWRPSREGIEKNMKRQLLEMLFFKQVCDKCWHFSGHVFHMFS